MRQDALKFARKLFQWSWLFPDQFRKPNNFFNAEGNRQSYPFQNLVGQFSVFLDYFRDKMENSKEILGSRKKKTGDNDLWSKFRALKKEIKANMREHHYL